jgi:fibronectin type 3 domain-containing protein
MRGHGSWLLPVRRAVIDLAFCLLACAGLSACHHSSGSSQQQPPQNPPPNTIGSSGGTATSSNGNASVVIPANALSQATTITIQPASGAPAGNVGTAYDFGPNGTTFSQPVTIEIDYVAANLPAGVTEADLVLAKVVNGQWQVIADSGAKTAGTVSGSTSSFSTYGMVPQTPGNVGAVPADGQVTVTWDPVNLATSYNVYWRRTDGTNSDVVRGVLSPYVHTGLTNGKEYGYLVSAQKPIGEGGKSSPEVLSTPMAAGTLPGQTMNVIACAGNQEVSLSWDAVQDATFYSVDRNDGSMFDGIGTTTYVDGTAVNGTTYDYTVTAINAVGSGTPSTPATVTVATLSAPGGFGAQPRPSSVLLTWQAVPCADSYLVHWEGGGLNDDIPILDPTTVEYTHTGLQNGTTYTYTIASVNALGVGAASAPVEATPQDAPVPMQISAGDGTTCVVYTDGQVKCMGTYPGNGTSGSTTPVAVAGIDTATFVSVGNNHSCAVDAGAVKCWGANNGGQLDSSTSTSPQLFPVTVNGITTASVVAAGASVTCAIVDGGTVKCWGNSLAVGNLDLMTGTVSPTTAPFTVDLPAAAVHLSVGKLRGLACAVLVTSETWCWGDTFAAMEIDDPGPSFRCTFNLCLPVLAKALGPTAMFTEVGRTHACYIPLLTTLGAVCVGAAQGDTFTGLNPPVVFDVISAGEDFNCGLSGSNAICWGWNGDGQLGNGTRNIEPFTTAVPAVGVNDATAVSAGFMHACAISSGVVMCWGTFFSSDLAPRAIAGF